MVFVSRYKNRRKQRKKVVKEEKRLGEYIGVVGYLMLMRNCEMVMSDKDIHHTQQTTHFAGLGFPSVVSLGFSSSFLESSGASLVFSSSFFSPSPPGVSTTGSITCSTLGSFGLGLIRYSLRK